MFRFFQMSFHFNKPRDQFFSLVHRILDIVDADLSDTTAGSRDGIEACSVIGDRINEIIDLAGVIRLADPAFFTRNDSTEGQK